MAFSEALAERSRIANEREFIVSGFTVSAKEN
jgi:hypothetical protein